jgi:hypothetical protein
VETLGRLVCGVTGKHRWDYARDICMRCNRTGTEIVAGAMTTYRLVELAGYRRGFEEGSGLSDAAKALAYGEGYTAGYVHGERIGASDALEELDRRLTEREARS